MAFQTAMFQNTASVVPGDMWNNSPMVSSVYTLASTDPTFNIIGQTIFTVLSQTGLPVNSPFVMAGGTGAFAGLLVNSKVYPGTGTPGQPLAANFVLPNGGFAEIASEGAFGINIPAIANIGDWVIYEIATGAISTQLPNTAIAVGFASANATIVVANATAPGTAIALFVSAPVKN